MFFACPCPCSVVQTEALELLIKATMFGVDLAVPESGFVGLPIPTVITDGATRATKLFLDLGVGFSFFVSESENFLS